MVLNKIVLTGATGMLGRHVRETLQKVGVKVVALSREYSPNENISGWDLATWLPMTELDDLFDGAQAVVHVGAMLPKQTELINEGLMFQANVRACLNLGQWAISRNVPVVHISGAIVYAEHDRHGLTEDAALGWSGLGGFYGFSKLLAEDVFKRLTQQGLNLAILRPTSIYGFGLSTDKMISRFLTMAREGRVIELNHPVEDRVDFVHAADVALAILAILETEDWDTFNIASGHAVSIIELAEACISIAGRGSVFLNKDSSTSRLAINRYALNIDKAKSRLGWHPKFDIKQGLRLMHHEILC
jgi:nucleoside-diphosphate-sugar epimerase